VGIGSDGAGGMAINVPTGKTIGLNVNGSNVIMADESATIVNSTNLLVGTASALNLGKLSLLFDEQTVIGATLKSSNATTGGSYMLLVNSSGATAGSIAHNGSTSVAFNTSSDGRIKPHREAITDSGAVIDALEPIYHNWIDDPNARVPGFIAQDVYQIVPSAATPGDNDPNKLPGDDGFKMWMREDSKLIPFLVAEIKALRARVAALEA
jgi:hypothetical protein